MNYSKSLDYELDEVYGRVRTSAKFAAEQVWGENCSDYELQIHTVSHDANYKTVNLIKVGDNFLQALFPVYTSGITKKIDKSQEIIYELHQTYYRDDMQSSGYISYYNDLILARKEMEKETLNVHTVLTSLFDWHLGNNSFFPQRNIHSLFDDSNQLIVDTYSYGR